MSTQIETFKKHLEQFAIKHKNEIRKNAEFRNHFQQMCARIGVDPLACMFIIIYSHVIIMWLWLLASKGFWAQALGVGDFYYEVLYVHVIITVIIIFIYSLEYK